MSFRGSKGGWISRSRASSSVFPPLRWLHGLHAVHEVLPRVPATAMARDDVVERHVVRLATAVLARVPIAREDLPPRELDARPRSTDQVLESDDGRRAILGPRRPDHLMVVFDHFGPFTEDETKGPRQVADVERFVVLVQYEYDTVHRRGR